MDYKLIHLVSAAVLISLPAYASKNVSSPYVTAGKLVGTSKTEVSVDDDDDESGSWEQTFELTYGVTDRFAVQASVELEDEPGEDIETKEIELEGKIEFTEKGAYFVDSGVKFEYEKKTNTGADEISATLLLAKKIGKVSNGANVKIEKEVGDDSGDHEEYEFKWKSKYDYSESFDLGVEYYADFGDSTEEYSGQKHRLGPVLYGKLGEVGYQAGILAGISKAAPDATLTLNLKYAF